MLFGPPPLVHVSFWQSDYGQPLFDSLIAVPLFVLALWLCDSIPEWLRRRRSQRAAQPAERESEVEVTLT